ncbi:MAG: hypothetical protein UD936_10170 [Acutalibacteraceae bacterium]|nr:hypothetical protein [Acutalibacteraceae bacterium]
MNIPFFKKETKEEKELKQSRAELADDRAFNDKVFEVGVRLRGLKRKYNVIIEREKRAIQRKRETGRDDKRSVSILKNAYYSIYLIEDAQERLVEIANHRELCKAMNGMSATFKLMNGISVKSDKVKDFLLKYRVSRMNDLKENEQERLDKHFLDPIDALVGDDVVENLIKGRTVEECMRDQDGIKMSLSEAQEVATVVYNEDVAQLDGELTMEDIDDVCNEWAESMMD